MKDERSHFSKRKKKLTKALNKVFLQTNNDGYKPNGFWYSVGDSWPEWCIAENFRTDTLRYKHVLEFNNMKLLRIDTLEKFDEFEQDFGYKPFGTMVNIDWIKVAKKYDGIEIAPYFWERRLSRMWYYPWDVASGCIWNTKELELLKIEKYDYRKKDKSEYA